MRGWDYKKKMEGDELQARGPSLRHEACVYKGNTGLDARSDHRLSGALVFYVNRNTDKVQDNRSTLENQTLKDAGRQHVPHQCYKNE